MSLKITCIYEIRNVKNGRHYIGSTVDFEGRKAQHLYDFKVGHYNWKLKRDWTKCDSEDFVFSILEEVELIKDVMLLREQYYIDSTKPYYNIQPVAGSMLGCKHSDESKLRISKANSGKVRSEDVKQKCRVASTGSKRSEKDRLKMRDAQLNSASAAAHLERLHQSNKGRKHTEESKAKISAGNKGKFLSPETRHKISTSNKNPSDVTRKRMSDAHKGKVISDEQRKKLSVAGLGRVVSEETKAKQSLAGKGRRHSDETKLKISNTKKANGMSKVGRMSVAISNKKRCVPVVQMSLSGVFVKEFSSIKETEVDGFTSSSVTYCCKGVYKKHKGYRFLYKKDFVLQGQMEDSVHAYRVWDAGKLKLKYSGV